LYSVVQNLEYDYRSHPVTLTHTEQGNVQFCKTLMMEFHIWNHILYGLSPSPHGKNNN
jgi:hypothetical protein